MNAEALVVQVFLGLATMTAALVVFMLLQRVGGRLKRSRLWTLGVMGNMNYLLKSGGEVICWQMVF